MGYSLLLPMLDVMVPSTARADTSTPPRFIAMLMSLGTYGRGYDPTKNGADRYPSTPAYQAGGQGVWVPKTTGAFSAPLPPALAPLESLKQKVSVISGLGTLVGDPHGNVINHSAATTLWSTSAWKTQQEAQQTNISGSNTTPANANPPDSIDQYIANAIGLTPGSTLVMSPGGGGDFSETGQGGHGGAISYNSKLSAGGSSVVPRVADPKKAFNALFGNCMNSPDVNAGKRSVLDYVQGNVTAVQKKLGTQDKARLDSYLQHVRDLETKLATVTQCPTAPTPSPATGSGLDGVTTLNMMVDVIALAIASGAMPIASLMTNVESSDGGWAAAGVSYLSNYVGINGNKVAYHSSSLDTHFDITHVEYNSTQAIEEHIAYTQMNVSFAQRLIQKLNSMPVEPNGFTPLDNTVVLLGSAHANSGDHDTHNLPILVAGGKRYGMAQGQHIAFPVVTDIGDFYYTMAKAMNVAGASFNGHSTVLPGVFA